MIDWRHKGFPDVPEGLLAGDLAARGWNLLAGDLLPPVVVVKESALEHNVHLMGGYCDERGVSFAPHGKTTMSPQILSRQLAAGAWGLTAATAAQARVYVNAGVDRIILANQLVDPAGLAWLATQLGRDPAVELYCLVDSVEGVEIMARSLSHVARPAAVLVELGAEGGRCGCRTIDDALTVAEAVVATGPLELAGVEAYEGLFDGELGRVIEQVDLLLEGVRTAAETMAQRGLFDGRSEVLLTAGGSTHFDRVVEVLGRPFDFPARVVVRAGSYVAHDSGRYEQLSPLGARATGDERLRAALEAWGVVLSRPEDGLAIVGLGKRDVAHDLGPPVPLLAARHGRLRDVAGRFAVTGLNDQHAYLSIPAADPLKVGDLVGCGIDHPCTTFDKWRVIPVVDDEYRVIDAVETFF